MTEDWRERMDATLEAIAQARIQAAADAKDVGNEGRRSCGDGRRLWVQRSSPR